MNRFRFLVFFLWVFLLLSLPLGLQAGVGYTFRHLEREQGLSHLSTTCFLQDSRGYVWIGTRLGLNIYDGVRFRVFYPDESDPYSLPDAYVTAMAEGGDGSVWVGTTKGICVFDYQNGTFSYRRDIQIPVSSYVACMLFDKDSNLWFTAGSLYSYNVLTRQLKTYPDLPDVSTSRLLLSSTNDIWTVSLSGVLYRYDKYAGQFEPFPLFTDEERRRMTRPAGMAETSDGRIVVGTTEAGLKVVGTLDHSVSVMHVRGEDGKDDYIHDVICRQNGDVWVGSEHGVYIIPKSEFQPLAAREEPTTIHLMKDEKDVASLSDNIVHILFEDREQGIWVGTFFGGVNYYASALQDFSRVSAEEGFKTAIARELVFDDAGVLWVATETCGLFSCSLGRHDILRHVPLTWGGHDISKNIHALMLDAGKLWLGTFNEGIYVYDTKASKVVKHYARFSSNVSFNDKAVVKILKTKDGDILVGNMSGFYWFNQRDETFHDVEGISSPFVHWIYQTCDGTVWMAALFEGLYKLRKEGEGYKAELIDTKYKDLTTLYEDSHGNFWVGTNTHGLFLYDRKQGKSISMNLNVCKTNKVIGRIVEDKNSCLWISTSDGLYSYNLKTGEEIRYGVHNSLPTDQFNVSSGILAPDGMMYFGTMKGLIKFNPYKLNSQKNTYKVYFTDMNQSESAFSVNFAVPIYSSAQSLWYRYKLEGVDDDWTVVQGAQNVKYNNLMPGTYILQAQASTINGLWSDSEADCSALVVTIDYPPLLSPLAIIIYILVLTSAGILVVRNYRQRGRQRQRRRIAELMEEMDKELMSDKIKFFTDITHEIRTPLTLIMGGLERIERVCNEGSVGIMRQNADRLQNLVNQLLDFRKMEASSFMIDIRLIDITPIINNICTTFIPVAEQLGLDFKVANHDKACHVMADPEAVTKIVNNMLSNAFKYCEHEVEVCISVTNHQAQVRVNNDGARISHEDIQKVFIPFRQIYHEGVNTRMGGTGLGLPLAKKMAELQDGAFYYDESHSKNSFVFSLPEASDDPDADADARADDDARAQTTSPHGQQAQAQASETILVVDDEEQLRQFVAEELSVKYKVLQAENGRQALEVLAASGVSLIVTDIMMPVIDGIKLCRQVKADIRFCHIPVVMLTAKVSLGDHIEALNSKSDAYIEKPFHVSQLIAQIDNLLANRKLLISSYVRSPYAQPETVTSNTLDNDFLKELTHFILSTMPTQTVNVDSLAEHAHMSRPTLYRKIKGLTSLSPLEFIHYCKLKKAAEMLSDGKTTIKQASDLAGYASVSHFTACFTKQFGVTPGKFVSQTAGTHSK